MMVLISNIKIQIFQMRMSDIRSTKYKDDVTSNCPTNWGWLTLHE